MADRLRVGMLAPIAWRVTPRLYGPWERVVSILTEGLVARGVEATLFARADSMTRARFVAVAPRRYAEDLSLDAKVSECLHVGAAFEQGAGDMAGAVSAVHQVSRLDRRATRAHAERHFSAERMVVDDYLHLYHRLPAQAHGTMELAVLASHPRAVDSLGSPN
jgi:hypothetical protein